ncbi:MAG: hypothetical protein ABSH02_11635 [Candidatus Sulfotelmatobacter sp.]|jgi:hypothetical protein
MPPAAARKTVTLRQFVHHDLTVYALAASAAGVTVLALTQPADGQIVYTPAHEQIGRNGKMLIDLNNDGITDVVVREIPRINTFRSNSLQAVPRPVGGIKQGSYLGFAAAMRAGSRIGSPDVFDSKIALIVNWTLYGDYYRGSWAGAPTSYLGIKFPIKGDTHYGWVRLNAQYNSQGKDIDVLMTGYAYETQPNTAIRAGDEGEKAGSAPEKSGETAPQSHSAAKCVMTLGILALGAQNPYLSRCSD